MTAIFGMVSRGKKAGEGNPLTLDMVQGLPLSLRPERRQEGTYVKEERWNKPDCHGETFSEERG